MGWGRVSLAFQFAQTGDADGVEFIEVGGGNRQETQPFQERHARVLGLFENAHVEPEPAQFAVIEALGAFDLFGGQLDGL